MVTKEENERGGGGWWINYKFGINIHTAIYKIDKQQGSTI